MLWFTIVLTVVHLIRFGSGMQRWHRTGEAHTTVIDGAVGAWGMVVLLLQIPG